MDRLYFFLRLDNFGKTWLVSVENVIAMFNNGTNSYLCKNRVCCVTTV